MGLSREASGSSEPASDEGLETADAADDWVPGAPMPAGMLVQLLPELTALADKSGVAAFEAARRQLMTCGDRASVDRPHEWASMVAGAKEEECGQCLLDASSVLPCSTRSLEV